MLNLEISKSYIVTLDGDVISPQGSMTGGSRKENSANILGRDREIERVITLKIVDSQWMEHIDNMDELKNGIGLRAYGQKDPVVQYRIEGFDMFDAMVDSIRADITKAVLHLQKAESVTRSEVAEITDASLKDTAISLVDGNITEKEGGINKTVVKKEPEVGRNEPCPCGSGKKYKQCCGK